MNKAQRVVLISGAVLLVLSMAFLPYKRLRAGTEFHYIAFGNAFDPPSSYMYEVDYSQALLRSGAVIGACILVSVALSKIGGKQ